MAGKDIGNNWEKENIRLHLLASTLCLTGADGFKASHGRWAKLWQRLFTRSRLH